MRRSYCFFILSILLTSAGAAQTSLQELLSLPQYQVHCMGTAEVCVYDPRTNMQVFDYSVVEAAAFISCDECKDTLVLDPKQFPNLKSVTFTGNFYNELLEITKIKTLECIDISALSRGDFNMYSYKLFFPPEFWSLSNLQILVVSAEQLSDLSENISRLPNLKILNIFAHESAPQIILPWSLLLHKNLRVLGLPFAEIGKQEDVILFMSQAPFEITYSGDISQTFESISSGKTESERRQVEFAITDHMLLLQNDSLQLSIPLMTDDDTRIHGVASLKKNGQITQERNYRNGLAHGKWRIDDAIARQTRGYSNGIPVGRWKFIPKVDNHPKQVIRYSHDGSNLSIGTFFSGKSKYINYNDVLYFMTPLD